MTDTTNINSTIYNIIMGERYLDGPLNRVVSIIMKLFNSATLIILMTVLFILFNIILDYYRSRIVYRDVLEHIDELINFF